VGLPPAIKTIAIPALKNETARYRIEQRLTEALVKEFLARARYRMVSDPAQADAALYGAITGIDSTAVLFDTATGRATTMLVTVKLRVRLETMSICFASSTKFPPTWPVSSTSRSRRWAGWRGSLPRRW
jgi:hypothetical protein